MVDTAGNQTWPRQYNHEHYDQVWWYGKSVFGLTNSPASYQLGHSQQKSTKGQ